MLSSRIIQTWFRSSNSGNFHNVPSYNPKKFGKFVSSQKKSSDTDIKSGYAVLQTKLARKFHQQFFFLFLPEKKNFAIFLGLFH